MPAIFFSFIAAICMFGGALLGMWLQVRLPKHHLDKESHETIKLGIGIIGSLSALVLGLLVSSAKGTYDTLNDGLVKTSANSILLNRILVHYGPEAKPARETIQLTLLGAIHRLWPDQPAPDTNLMASVEQSKGLEDLQQQLEDLKPQNESQRALLSEADQLVAEMTQNRWFLIEQAKNQLPTALIVIMIFWLTMIFISFGLFAPRHGTVIAVMLACSLSMAGAILLIEELNRPLIGFIRLSSAPMRDALAQVSQ